MKNLSFPATALFSVPFPACPAVRSMVSGTVRRKRVPGGGLRCERGAALTCVVMQLAACSLACAAGESLPVEVFRPNTTPQWRNSWFAIDLELGPSRLVVGSEQSSSSHPGMVHIYRRAGGNWELEQVLTHLQLFDNASFGSDVALSDDERTLFVGAPLDGSSNLGAVYVFHRSEGGGWTAAGKLVAPDGEELDHFGGTVEVSGDHLAVSAYRTNDGAFDSGSVHLFTRQPDLTWMHTQKITLPDATENDLFGNQIDLEDGLLVVSTVTRDLDGFSDQGLVQTYQHDPASGQWRDIGRLTAHDGSPADFFGSALALSGNRLAVGAYGRGVPKPHGIDAGQGSVYLYERDPGQPSGWRWMRLIKSDDGAAGDWFGRSVSFHGDLLVVGAPRKKNAAGISRGAAYAFQQNSGGIADNWRQVHKFNHGGSASSPWFGDDVVLSETDVFIGARLDSDVAPNQGSLSRFERLFDLSAPERNHDQWLRSHFTAEELATPGLRHTRWGGFADPDGDLLANDAEYFAGLDPLVADPMESLPQADFRNGNLVWNLTRASDPARSAVAYLASGDRLHNWRRRSDTLITTDGTSLTLTLPDYRQHGSRQFFRLAYEMP